MRIYHNGLCESSEFSPASSLRRLWLRMPQGDSRQSASDPARMAKGVWRKTLSKKPGRWSLLLALPCEACEHNHERGNHGFRLGRLFPELTPAIPLLTRFSWIISGCSMRRRQAPAPARPGDAAFFLQHSGCAGHAENAPGFGAVASVLARTRYLGAISASGALLFYLVTKRITGTGNRSERGGF